MDDDRRTEREKRGSIGSHSSEEKRKGLSEGKADKDGRGKRMKKKNPAHEQNGIDEGNAELKKRHWRAKCPETDKAEVVKKTNSNWTEV